MVTEAEGAWLESEARRYNVTISELLRVMVRKEMERDASRDHTS